MQKASRGKVIPTTGFEVRGIPPGPTRPRGGLRCWRFGQPREARDVDRAEHRRSRRQQGHVGEVVVEREVSGGRTVDRVAALERPGGLAAVVQTDDRALVVRRAAAGFEQTQEVVRAAVRAEVWRRDASRPQEVDPLAGYDLGAIYGVAAAAAAAAARPRERI